MWLILVYTVTRQLSSVPIKTMRHISCSNTMSVGFVACAHSSYIFLRELRGLITKIVFPIPLIVGLVLYKIENLPAHNVNFLSFALTYCVY